MPIRQLILCLLLVSCASQKNEYDAVVKVIDDLKSPVNKRDIDTIEIVDYSFKLKEVLLKGYLNQKEIKLNQKVKPSSNFFEWTSEKYAWVLTEPEINHMIVSLRNQKKIFWDKEKLINSKKNIRIVDYPIFADHVIEDIERQKRIKLDKFNYFLSQPVFNKKKDVFIIEYEILLLPFSKMTLIYKKENGNWIQIASLSPHW